MIYLALLRGINVGGKNLVPMRDLAPLFREAGCRKVQTYIQSGNVIFDVDSKASESVHTELTSTIATRFGFRVPILFRTAEQMDTVLENNPFLQPQTPEAFLHVYFLAKPPSPEQIAQLDPARSAPDSFFVQGSEIYLRLPNGMARTKLTNSYFDLKLSTTCTARNWRTAQKLRELMRQ